MKWRQVKKNGHLEWELMPNTKDEILKDAGKYADEYEKENGFTTHPKTASFHGYIAGYDAAKLETPIPDTDGKEQDVDIYSGELNEQRIKEYRRLAEAYNITESSVRDIFCRGADWYKSQSQNQSPLNNIYDPSKNN